MIRFCDGKGKQTTFGGVPGGGTFEYSNEQYIKVAREIGRFAVRLSDGRLCDMHMNEKVIRTDLIVKVEYK